MRPGLSPETLTWHRVSRLSCVGLAQAMDCSAPVPIDGQGHQGFGCGQVCPEAVCSVAEYSLARSQPGGHWCPWVHRSVLSALTSLGTEMLGRGPVWPCREQGHLPMSFLDRSLDRPSEHVGYWTLSLPLRLAWLHRPLVLGL